MTRAHRILSKADRDGTIRHIAPALERGDIELISERRSRFAWNPGEDIAPSVDDTPMPPPAARDTSPPVAARPVFGATLDKDMVAALQPFSPAAEQFRTLRTRIAQVESAGQRRIILVTSPGDGDGKTVTVANLALTMAQEFQRQVLLIDADLRKPSIHRQMGVEASTGLLEHLMKPANEEGLSDILFTESQTGLLALVGARRSDIPTDQVIASKAFDDLIQLARTHFEMVVIDTPPVGPVVDGLYLAKFADAIAFVVRWASTSQRDARDAAHSLESAKRPGVPTLVILNQQEGSAASYRNKYAGYYNEAY
jgi:polysaccharide biosynthesis transport protein